MTKYLVASFAILMLACSSPAEDVDTTPAADNVHPQAKDAGGGGNTKTVRLQCGSGQTAGTGGSYGGVGVDLACNHGHADTVVIIPTGTVWSFRIGVEDNNGAYDCAFSGDSATVSESCVGTVITVQ